MERRIAERRDMFTGQMKYAAHGAGYAGFRMRTAGTVDFSNATYEEMRTFADAMLAQGSVSEGAFDFLKEPEGEEQRYNYLEEVKNLKTQQRDSGDMEGYRKVQEAYEAMRSLTCKSVYLESESGQIAVSYRQGEQTSGVLGLGAVGNVPFFARYAEHSTAERPIVEVCLKTSEGEQRYYVDVNAIDKGRATEMELFALLSHCEKQGMAVGNPNLYQEGRAEGIFDACNLIEFLYTNQDWNAKLSECTDQRISETLLDLLASFQNADNP